MNALVGERGLESGDRLPQLVIDRRSQPLTLDLDTKLQLKEQRHCSVHAPLYSSDESDSGSDMDRRLKRGRGGRRRRSRHNQRASNGLISSAKQQQLTTSHKDEEGIKVQMQIYVLMW